MTSATAIAPLTKVTLTLTTSTPLIQSTTDAPSVDFTFVFGIGIEGLTEFELAILGKAPGDRVSFHVGKVPPTTQFEHLLKPLLKVLQTPAPSFDLHIGVKTVAPVTERELVHALSQKTEGSGCGCDGGCGCGG